MPYLVLQGSICLCVQLQDEGMAVQVLHLPQDPQHQAERMCGKQCCGCKCLTCMFTVVTKHATGTSHSTWQLHQLPV
jgi:hypothetical protein